MRITAVPAAMLACAAASFAWTPASARPPASLRIAAAATARSAPVYRVELVVFRATTALGSPEDWAVEAGGAPAASTDTDPGANGESAGPPNRELPGGDPATIASAGNAPPSIVARLLPSSAFQLDSVAERLRASGRYVPVAHVAWAQTASPWGRPVEIPLRSIGLDAQDITGTVALERGQFLHLALDLRYTMSDPPPGLDAPPGTVFVLDQSHRVRLRERNYFDHPAFGVIALVTLDEAGHVRSR